MKILVFFFLCYAVYAQELCLMLSPAEEAALSRAEGQAKKKGNHTKNPGTLRLNGIIYIHPQSWTIWLNDRAIKAGGSIDTVRILNVTPESVELIWSPSPDQHHQICLKPNEVFQDINVFP